MQVIFVEDFYYITNIVILLTNKFKVYNNKNKSTIKHTNSFLYKKYVGSPLSSWPILCQLVMIIELVMA